MFRVRSHSHQTFEQALWDSRKITLLDQTAEAFFPWLLSEVQTVASQTRVQADSVPAVFGEATSISQETINQLRSHFEVVGEELLRGAPDFEDFFRGNRPSWGQIAASCDVTREITDDIILDLLEQKDFPGPRIALIRAEAGSGKTTLLRRVGAELARTWDLPVLSLRASSSIDFDLVDTIARLSRDRLFILLDEAAGHARELSEFVTRARRAATRLTIVGAARANEWAERTRNLRSLPYQPLI